MTAPSRTEPVIPTQRQVPGAAVYAVVQFDGEQVRDVIVAFEDARAATRFATANRLAHYTVVPIAFHIDDRPTGRPGLR
ncbi:MAG: hypothetical protein ACQSGP_03815 [Frankia sp.]